MIEITSENVWYRKKKRRFKFKRFFSFLLVFLVLIGIYFYYNRAISNQVINICVDYAYSYSTDSVNKAVLGSLSNKVKYEDLITVDKNQSGDIVLMSTNSYKVNMINKEIAESTKIILENKLKEGMPIPLFAFTGIPLLSGFGRPVTIKTLSVSFVVCEFYSVFKSVGINQTLHSVYIVVSSKVLMEMPLKREEVVCKTDVMVCEAVLVGKVPDTYLEGGLFSLKNV